MTPVFWSYLTVATGGALGAVARYALSGISVWAGGGIPVGTLASNILGCFVMGAIAQLSAGTSWFNDAGLFPDHYRLLFAVGFCGSFTTLSALVYEMSTLLERGQVALAFGYFVLTMVGAFAGFYLAVAGVRVLTQGQ